KLVTGVQTCALPISAEKRGAAPLREHRALVEHEIARSDDGRPVDHRLGEIRSCVGTWDRHAVVVGSVRHEWPAVILAWLDQVQQIGRASCRDRVWVT